MKTFTLIFDDKLIVLQISLNCEQILTVQPLLVPTVPTVFSVTPFVRMTARGVQQSSMDS